MTVATICPLCGRETLRSRSRRHPPSDIGEAENFCLHHGHAFFAWPRCERLGVDRIAALTAERDMLRAEIDSVRPKCSGDWIGGSGGHREHGPCGQKADWWHPDDAYAYCDKHLKAPEGRSYRRWTLEAAFGEAGRAALASHGPT